MEKLKLQKYAYIALIVMGMVVIVQELRKICGYAKGLIELSTTMEQQ